MIDGLLTLSLVGGAAAAGDGLRKILDPERRGAELWLSAAVAAISFLLVVGFALGSLGALRRLPLVLVVVAAAVALQWVARRRERDVPRPGEIPADDHQDPAWLRAAAAGGCAMALLVWASSAQRVFTRGVVDVDSHHYHLSHALRFAQTGEILPLHHVWSGDLAAYHPSNDELIRAMGMLVGRSDLPGVVWNLVPVLVALLAAFVFGRRVGRTSASVLVIAAALCMPGVARPFAGGASNDFLALSMVLAAIALGIAAEGTGSWLVVGAATGVAVGTKLTVLPAVVVLVVLVLTVGLGSDRVRRWALVGGAALTGGIWYVRNWAIAGNPVPGLDLPGPISFNQPAAPTLEMISHPVAEYLGDRRVIADYFLPGLDFAFGPVWFVLLPAVGIGIIAGVARFRDDSMSSKIAATCAAIAAIAIVSYVLTPTSAGGGPGDPWLFRSNARYLLPATTLGGWAAIVALRPRWATAFSVIAAAAAVVGAAATLTGFFSVVHAAVGLVLALAGAAVWHRWPRPTWLGHAALAAICVGAVASATVLRERYLDNQYEPLPRMGPLYLAVSDAPSGTRVGVVGLPEQYGFAGRDLQNHVEYLGRPTADDGFLAFDRCEALFSALVEGQLDFVAVNGDPELTPPVEQDWISGAPGFELVAQTSQGGWLYEVVGRPDPRSCVPR